MFLSRRNAESTHENKNYKRYNNCGHCYDAEVIIDQALAIPFTIVELKIIMKG